MVDEALQLAESLETSASTAMDASVLSSLDEVPMDIHDDK